VRFPFNARNVRNATQVYVGCVKIIRKRYARNALNVRKEIFLRKLLRNVRNASNARLQILPKQEIDPCSILAFPTQALTN